MSHVKGVGGPGFIPTSSQPSHGPSASPDERADDATTMVAAAMAGVATGLVVLEAAGALL